jgi:hypothetical protein
MTSASAHTELGGLAFSKGDKVVMWCVSGNRDESAISEPDRFLVDLTRPRSQLSYGAGIHRCGGADLQPRVLWEEILRRDRADPGCGTARTRLVESPQGFPVNAGTLATSCDPLDNHWPPLRIETAVSDKYPLPSSDPVSLGFAAARPLSGRTCRLCAGRRD